MYGHLIGNEPVKKALVRLAAAGRVPNALLFAGPEGVGKRQFALELARSFVCPSPKDGGDACAECAACRRAASFAQPASDKKEDYDEVFFTEHPDVGFVIPYKNNVRVGAIRDLEREANFRPFEAKARFFIVDEADKMNDAAANALLKTLEEPPPSTHIVLVTSRPDSLLQTIRSRCQSIKFAPVPAGEIAEFLKAEKKLSPADADLAARISLGSIGRAAATDVGVIRARREAMLGVLEDAVLDGNIAAVLNASESISDAKNKDNFDADLDILEALTRDVWLASAGLGAILNGDVEDRIKRLAAVVEPATAADWIDSIEAVRAARVLNLNKRVAADALFVNMVSG